MNMKRAICLWVLALVLLLASCGRAEGGVWYNGRELSESEIEELLIRGTESEEVEREGTLIAYREGDAAPTEDSMYWTAGGSVYHKELSCRHLATAKTIYYGTAEDAAKEKGRACTACTNQ